MGAVEPYNGDTFPLPPMTKVYEAIDPSTLSESELDNYYAGYYTPRKCESCGTIFKPNSSPSFFTCADCNQPKPRRRLTSGSPYEYSAQFFRDAESL